MFLHQGGAIGACGSINEINMRLSGSMSRYLLPPPSLNQLQPAVLASLSLVELGPPSIGFSLLAATVRAVFGNVDFALHLAGETGAFKSEVAALFQQHFGSEMARLNLPASWSWTANALETQAFHAKDVLLVIDDFAPQGNGNEVTRYHAAADRVFRSAGNQAGRGRLDASADLRPTKAPRALILSTGEEIPRGHSVRARLWILELAKGDIASTDLTLCQLAAGNGLYAQATSGFIQWMASRHNAVFEEFEQRRAALKAKARNTVAHARTPEIIANLQAAFDLYLEFALATGAITMIEKTSLSERCREALDEAANAQAKHQAATEPTAESSEMKTVGDAFENPRFKSECFGSGALTRYSSRYRVTSVIIKPKAR